MEQEMKQESAVKNDRVNRNLSREAECKERCETLDKLKIGIIGISEGAGVSFLTVCLARFLANTRKLTPAVVELGKPSIYDSLGMDKHFAGRYFFPFFRSLDEGKSIRGKKNMDEGINWVIRSPDEISLFVSSDQKLRLIGGVSGDAVIFDLSRCGKDDQAFLSLMDQVLVVIDPLPSRMLEGYQMLCRMKAHEVSGGDINYIINRDNRGVNHRQLMDFLKIRNPLTVPMASMESIYTAEYNCKIPYSMTDVKKQLQEPIRRISERLHF